MKTKTLVEGILYVSGNNPIVRSAFEICHILNKTDRNWKSEPHIELFYLDYFKRPYFLMVIDKQLHVYVIGDKAKGQTYNIICIEGFNADHYTISKGELRDKIYRDAKESLNLYLPDGFNQRIIFIKPDYENQSLSDDDIFCFNRQSNTGHLFFQAMWSLGPNVYSVTQPEYETSASEILKEICKEF